MRKNHCSRLRWIDLGAAALAAAVDDLLVGQHGGVLRAPLDRRLGAVGEAALEQLQEDPLGPAVVLGRVGGEFARPVDRDPPLAELAAEGLDRALGRDPRRLAGFDRVVLGRQAEGVVAHRVDHLEAVAAAEVGDRVADRVALEVADVGLARGVGQHLQHVGLRLVGRRSRAGRGWRPPRSSPRPRPLPLALDRFRVVARHRAAILRGRSGGRSRVPAQTCLRREGVVARREGLEDVGPDVDLDRRGEDQGRDRQRHGDEGRGEQLVPLAAAAGDQPGGERQEERGQLRDRVREDAEDQLEAGDVQLVGEGRALEAEVERLGGEREEGDRADEEDRQLARLDVDPARDAACAGRRRSASRRRR